MPEYVNPNSYTVHLIGPDGKVVKVRAKARITLTDYFDRYRTRGFIKRISDTDKLPVQSQVAQPKQVQSKIQLNRTAIRKKNRPSSPPPSPQQPQQPRAQIIKQTNQNQINEERKKRRHEISRARRIAKASKVRRQNPITKIIDNRKTIVGRRLNIDATELLQTNLEKNHFPISNNIGIGILSYNRLESLKRLIDSIIKYTDLRKTTIFISDDGSTNEQLQEYLKSLENSNNFIILHNSNNIGIAGNSNRLIRCLSRFDFGMLLNDDVVIEGPGWEYFYADAIKKTGMHHFLYRQIGVYGAELGEICVKNGVDLRVVNKRPHGAVMAFSREMLVKCGYFNEAFGTYGMEHVDWSKRVGEMGLQDQGFFDVEGSAKFFRINKDESVVPNRLEKLREAKKVFENRTPTRIGPTEQSRVPEITYVVPFRNTERNDSIITVINNIRAQRYPVIHIIMVEQDIKTRIDLHDFAPVFYYLAQETENPLFNKAIAFNLGVSKATTDKLILHDADMLVQGHYTKQVSVILDKADSCHLGGSVMYANLESTELINKRGLIDHDVGCDRVVGYFEGGSLACTKTIYWKVGGINQDYWGYGCEDCDFYARLSGYSRWKEDRSFDFLHLWHSRISGWGTHHQTNKSIEAELRKLAISERVKLQHKQLRRVGYEAELLKAMK